MIVGTAGANECDAQIRGNFLGFDIEIVEHLDMVADKADGRDDDLFCRLRCQVADGLADIRLEPRIASVYRYGFDKRATSADD